MKIFNAAHFLRYVSAQSLREFTDAHPVAPRLAMDWDSTADTLPTKVNAAIEALQASLREGGLIRGGSRGDGPGR